MFPPSSPKPWAFAAAVLCAVVIGAGAGEARGGFTAVKQPKRLSNPSHERILERVYGGNFVADAARLHFSNESGVTVTRLDDGAASDRSTGPGGAGRDDLWNARVVSARAVASFAGAKRTAAYFGTRSDGQVSRLLESGGRRFDVIGATGGAADVAGELWFGRGRRASRAFSSVANANRDGVDHLVTYRVTRADGAEPVSTYLLCWEDKLGRRGDRDYNDRVIELRTHSGEVATAAAASEPLLIPLPPALWSGLAGIIVLGGIRGTRCLRRRRA